MTARTILAAVVMTVFGMGDGALADAISGESWMTWSSGRNPDRVIQWHTGAPTRAGERISRTERSTSTSGNRPGSNANPAPATRSPSPTSNPLRSNGTGTPSSGSSGLLGNLGSNVVPEGGQAVATLSTFGTGSLSTGASATTTGPDRFDAFVNLGAGPYPSADGLASGNPKPWYSSSVVTQFFNGREPDSAARSQFTRDVLDRVEQTYLQSGLDISLTSDPNHSAAHTLSVVADSYYPGNSNAIGVADLKGDGFTFIDAFSPARDLDSLTWAVAKNVAHELMHAFGGDHHDETGRYLDAGIMSWDVLLKPEVTVFSPDSVAELARLDFQDRSELASLGFQGADGHKQRCGCQICHGGPLMQQTVPEPTTVALWSLAAMGLIVVGRRRQAQARQTR
ncbi:hypothetical protein BH23PLA1_BH23PLA1_00650 [soil metagenome]